MSALRVIAAAIAAPTIAFSPVGADAGKYTNPDFVWYHAMCVVLAGRAEIDVSRHNEELASVYDPDYLRFHSEAVHRGMGFAHGFLVGSRMKPIDAYMNLCVKTPAPPRTR